MIKLAFIFLIYDIINHEELWHMFFKNVDNSKYSIYIHYKTNVKLKYFNEYKVDKPLDTKYADISIVKAQNHMLEIALEDVNNTNFIFVSGACIPLKSFQYIYESIDSKYSYFHIADPEDSLEDCKDTLNYINKKYINKASQWCILNRKHSLLLVYGAKFNKYLFDKKYTTNYLVWFNNSYAPDELCYITYLSFIYKDKLDKEIIATYYNEPPEIATTFANWEGMKYKYVSEKELKNYISISEKELKHLLYSTCFFGRKFKPSASLSLRNNYYIDYISS